MMFGKKAVENQNSKENPQTPSARMMRRFRRHRLAVWSLRVLYGLVFIAVFGDFVANEKPLYCKFEGRHYFPVLKQYAVDLGLSKWEPWVFRQDWQERKYEAVIFPPVPYSPRTQDVKNGNKGPFSKQNHDHWRWRHWLGTDHLGHDTLAGLIAGTRIALLVGLIAMSIATFIGVLLGSLAGFFGDDGFRMSKLRLWVNMAAILIAWFYGFQVRSFELEEAEGSGPFLKSLFIFLIILAIANGLVFLLKKIPLRFFRKTSRVPVDLLVMRAIEVLNSIPGMLLLLSFVAVVESGSIFYVMVIIGLIRWTGIARFMRAEMLKVKSLGYIEAARAMGFSRRRILFRHALPNAIGPVLIAVAFGVASAILLESALSFLGIGVGEEGVTWGKLLSGARRSPSAWWLAVFPGAAIFVTVTVFNLIGEGLTEEKR